MFGRRQAARRQLLAFLYRVPSTCCSLSRALSAGCRRQDNPLLPASTDGGPCFLTLNGGDHPKFDWNMGGRLYSYGEFNYRQLERAERLKMTINGEQSPVCSSL